MAGAAGVAGSAVSAYASLKAGQAAADAANANAIMAGAQAGVARTTGDVNADTITAQGDFNAAEVARRTAFNASQIDRSVGDARTATEVALTQQRTVGDMRIGAQRAAAAASGITLEGSPLEVMAFQAQQNDLERLSIFTQGRARVLDLMAEAEATRASGAADVSAMRYDTAMRALTARATGQNQAAGFQSQVGLYRAQGSAAQTAGTLGAASSVLSGGSRFGGDAVGNVRDAASWVGRQIR